MVESQHLFLLLVLHDHKLTHTDLKPENILFVDSSSEYYKTKRFHNKVDVNGVDNL